MDTKAVPLTALRRDPSAVVRSVARDGRPRIVTRRGEPVAALLDLSTLRRLGDELEVLRALALGEVESAGGRGYPLEDVLSECDLLLEEN